MHKQLDVVRGVLDRARLDEVPVQGTLCFVDADWPLIGGSFVIHDVAVLWPKKLSERLIQPGEMSPATIATVHDTLTRTLPSA